MTGAIYYTDSQLNPKIAETCRTQLRKAFKGEIVSVSLAPLEFGDKAIHYKAERGYLTMFKQILLALETSTADVIYFTEHDVLYHPSHFAFVPKDDKFHYNLNWWKVREDGLAVHWDAVQVSGLVCKREAALNFYRSRVATFDPKNFDRKFEPTINGEYETWWSEYPDVDIRHDKNLTYNKWKLEHFRKKDTAVNFMERTVEAIPGWDNLTDMIKSS